MNRLGHFILWGCLAVTGLAITATFVMICVYLILGILKAIQTGDFSGVV